MGRLNTPVGLRASIAQMEGRAQDRENLKSDGSLSKARLVGETVSLGRTADLVSTGARDAGALTGFVCGSMTGPTLWISDAMSLKETGEPYAGGLESMDLAPHLIIHLRAKSHKQALWAVEEGLSCPSLVQVVLEVYGTPKALSLNALRRLTLRAEEHGVAFRLLRHGGEDPLPLKERWQVEAAPSAQDLRPKFLGPPAYRLVRLKHPHAPPKCFTLHWRPRHGFETLSDDLAAEAPARPGYARAGGKVVAFG